MHTSDQKQNKKGMQVSCQHIRLITDMLAEEGVNHRLPLPFWNQKQCLYVRLMNVTHIKVEVFRLLKFLKFPVQKQQKFVC